MTKTKSGVGEAHAKTILIGEHAVVYGKPAIALPLTTIKVKATVETLPADLTPKIWLASTYYNGLLTEGPESLQGFTKLIQTIQQELAPKLDSSFKVTIESAIPLERGMGSSAAIGIAIIRAFYDYFEQTLTPGKLQALANISETHLHQTPSGLDATTCASEVPVWLIKNQTLATIPLNVDGYLVICDSGIKGQTKKAIQAVKARLHTTPIRTQQALDQLADLAYQTRTALKDNNLLKLAQIFKQAQQALQTIGVSNEAMDQLISASEQFGSLGSKITGGGQGGCFICLTADLPTAQQLSTQLQAIGVKQTWIQPLNSKQ